MNDEPLGCCSFGEAHVERHEPFTVRLLLAPDQRRRQLQRIGCPKWMHGEQPAGPAPQIVGRRDGVGVLHEQPEAFGGGGQAIGRPR